MGSKPANPIRMTADIEGDFVVFMTGMHIYKLWKVHKWWGNMTAMMNIMPILFSNEAYGALGCHYWVNLRGLLLVGYFRSFEHLEHFANDKEAPHAQAWRDFYKRMGKDGDVGLWHETYLVRAGEYEAAYGHMREPTGLGATFAAEWVPVSARGDRAMDRRYATERAAAASSNGDGGAPRPPQIPAPTGSSATS